MQRDVNYTFTRGRVYAIVSESSACKNTLISLLAGLDSPTAGEVIFDGQDLRHMKSSEYRVRHIGLVFQGYNLLLRQSALDNVIVPLYLAGLPAAEQKARATALLESVGIASDKHHRTILQLSGGEQQRVAVAQLSLTNHRRRANWESRRTQRRAGSGHPPGRDPARESLRHHGHPQPRARRSS